jgi:hypothetical protein
MLAFGNMRDYERMRDSGHARIRLPRAQQGRRKLGFLYRRESPDSFPVANVVLIRIPEVKFANPEVVLQFEKWQEADFLVRIKFVFFSVIANLNEIIELAFAALQMEGKRKSVILWFLGLFHVF